MWHGGLNFMQDVVSSLHLAAFTQIWAAQAH